MSTNPNLNLEYDLSPSYIDVTIDSSNPVKNKLTLTIINPFDVPISFTPSSTSNNPDEGIHVPGQTDPVIVNSCFEIWFNYAPDSSKEEDRGSDLCTYAAAAANINMNPGTNASNWNAVKRDSSKVYNGRKIGTYWQLYPTSGTQLAAKESIAFDITDIISDTPADIATTMYIEVVDFPDYANTYEEESIYKKVPFKIKSFALSEDKVYEGGTTTLTWSTIGAEYVTFSPALDPSKPNEQYDANNLKGIKITPKNTGSYRMTAYDSSGKYVKSNTINLTYYPLVIHKFESSQDSVGTLGLVLFRWMTSGATSVNISLNGHLAYQQLSGQVLCAITKTTQVSIEASNLAGFTKKQNLKVALDTSITASGSLSTHQGADYPQSAAPGAPGSTGSGAGESGGNGKNGAKGATGHTPTAYEVPMSSGQGQAPKTLKIVGGTGQQGGHGGIGGFGSMGSAHGMGFPGGNGGNGGNGGKGGAGGGGSVDLTFTHTTAYPENIMLSLPASQGGAGGARGGAGQGGYGAGGPAPNGKHGKAGKAGSAGPACTIVCIPTKISQTEVEALIKAAEKEAKDPK